MRHGSQSTLTLCVGAQAGSAHPGGPAHLGGGRAGEADGARRAAVLGLHARGVGANGCLAARARQGQLPRGRGRAHQRRPARRHALGFRL